MLVTTIPAVSTTNVSPSQRPVEWPYHVGTGYLGCGWSRNTFRAPVLKMDVDVKMILRPSGVGVHRNPPPLRGMRKIPVIEHTAPASSATP